MLPLLMAIAFAAPQASDTTLVLAHLERDLTGDGQAELLQLRSAAGAPDTPDLIFSIASAGSLLYQVPIRLPSRRVEPSERPPPNTTNLDEFGRQFFADSKFTTPAGFLRMLSAAARAHVERVPAVIGADLRHQGVVDSLLASGVSLSEAHRVASARVPMTEPAGVERAEALWRAIQAASVTVFEYSPGGDGVTAIAWSALERRFVRLWLCC